MFCPGKNFTTLCLCLVLCGPRWCLYACDRLCSVCEVVLVPYVDAVVAVTVMRVLLFCILRECEGARVTEMLVWGWLRYGCGEYMACGWYTWFRYCV